MHSCDSSVSVVFMWCDENMHFRVRLAANNSTDLVLWRTHKWSSRGVWLYKMVVVIGIVNVGFTRAAPKPPDTRLFFAYPNASPRGAAAAPLSS